MAGEADTAKDSDNGENLWTVAVAPYQEKADAWSGLPSCHF